ncbi:hypothetical protein [Erythrobacter sp. SG61-1L]|uniref:hypothetical protein n=1 Tax=Erythrobacter sp. SG61-1L TaxID=1603897 RepID=UPI0012E132A6|nr:hypothetical protein [Erythrobacter sp. SG61-1L]
MLARDKADRNREAFREQAEMEVREGVFVNLAGTVVEPTQEWLEKADTTAFIPKQPKGTVRVIKTVKRLAVPVVVRLCSDGKLSFEAMMACKRYREIYELTGLDGRVAIARYGIQGTMPGRVMAPSTRMPIAEWEAVAREEYRAARDIFKPRHRKFFEAIVLEDNSPRKARAGTCRNGKETKLFSALATALVRFYQDFGVRLVQRAGDGED